MSEPTRATNTRGSIALRFVLMIGALSFFADFTYEGSRSVLGPYLAQFGASAFAVGVITGAGEFLGYSLRLFSGRWASSTGQYWPITISGYVIQMAAVPALALAGNWVAAAALIILERVGKAMRNPPRDAMLAHAAKEAGGYGWAFGLHEALDQAGALVGPLVVAGVIAWQGSIRIAFAVLAVPAVINLTLVVIARALYPQPGRMEVEERARQPSGYPKVFWVYLAGAGLVAAGFADYPLVAYHFARSGVVPGQWIAIFYAVAMGVSGGGSLAFGRLFDRFGYRVLVGLTIVSALFAPLVFWGGFWTALLGVALWGLGTGVHESIIPAAVAPMTSPSRRASAFGLFTGGYGLAWFLGSAVIGFLYGRSPGLIVVFCVVLEIAAIPLFLWVAHQSERPA